MAWKVAPFHTEADRNSSDVMTGSSAPSARHSWRVSPLRTCLESARRACVTDVTDVTSVAAWRLLPHARTPPTSAMTSGR
jgi:hypothetical protein